MTLRRAIAPGFLALALAAPAAAKDELAPDFDEALVLARRHIATEAGASYDGAKGGPWFQETHSRSIQLCFESLAEPDVSPFRLVVALDAEGDVERAYLDADTNVSLCLRAAVASSAFPAPPFAPFYQPFILNFEP